MMLKRVRTNMDANPSCLGACWIADQLALRGEDDERMAIRARETSSRACADAAIARRNLTIDCGRRRIDRRSPSLAGQILL